MTLRSILTAPIRSALHALGLQRVDAADALAHVDPAIAQTVREVLPFTMTSPARVAALCEAVEYVVRNRVPGGIVECGVWKGGSMMAVARTLVRLGDPGRELYLFDTFEGMTAPTEKDIAITGESAAQLMAREDRRDPRSVWCVSPLEEVRQAVLGTGYDAAKVHFVKGRVEDTLPGRAPERIALLRLDTDWYESTRHEMEHLFPRLARGGVLIVDDYGHWGGARQAVDEYLGAHRVPLLLHRIDYTGRCAVKWQA